MRILTATALCALTAHSAQAQTSATFNLICTGAVETTSFTGTNSEPYRTEYRIDLARNLWCDGNCEATRPLAAINPTQLTLQDRNVDTVSQREMLSDFINRQTGEHHIFAVSGRGQSGMAMEWRGHCERAPFSGFPQFETRF